MAEDAFARLVSLACHDLRTPLATINGLAKTLVRGQGLGERESRFVEMIDGAAGQLAGLLEELSVAARIADGRYEPVLADADTLELACSSDERILVTGNGEVVATDVAAVRRSLESLAITACRHGSLDSVTWSVTGRELVLSPVTEDAEPVVTGESPRELGALVARAVIEQLGGTLTAGGRALHVKL